MVEKIDYLVQIVVAFVGCAMAAISFNRTKKLPFFLLGGFYITFGLGDLYLFLHFLLTGKYPFFCTGELAWSASLMFLLALYHMFPSQEEKRFFAPAALAAPFIGTAFCAYFIITHSDPLGNFLLCGPITFLGYYSLRGLLFEKKHPETSSRNRFFHAVILTFFLLEYSLWMWSCFWVSDTMTNPYFWCDFLISADMLLLYPAVRKACSHDIH